ncbi:MAG: leucine-rich repeat domain-containing protein, partial [Flavobacteriales bacterium]|nr:leucine-rich repeat domain-containing protein [Flavobacteriales bacterium]
MKAISKYALILALFCPFLASAITFRTVDISKEDYENVTKLNLNDTDLSKQQLNLDRFPNLETLSLRNTNLQSIKKSDLKQMQNIKVLDLSDNPLIQLASILRNYPANNNLQELKLENCALLFIPMEIQNLRSITSLDLSGNRIVYLPEQVKFLNQLKKVDLQDNQLAALPFGMMSWQRLEVLNLAGNEGLSPESVVKMLKFIPELTSIDMSRMVWIPKNVNELKAKEMRFNQMKTNRIPESLVENTSLKRLVICGSKHLDKEQEVMLSRLSNINQLSLESNQLTDVKWLSTLKALKVLNLSSNS